MHENKHLGKISILVGAESEDEGKHEDGPGAIRAEVGGAADERWYCTLDWHIAPFRADRWLDLWEPAAAKMPAFGAHDWSLIRSNDDPLAFRQSRRLGEPQRLRTLLVLRGDRGSPCGRHRPLRHPAAARLAHPHRRRLNHVPG